MGTWGGDMTSDTLLDSELTAAQPPVSAGRQGPLRTTASLSSRESKAERTGACPSRREVGPPPPLHLHGLLCSLQEEPWGAPSVPWPCW